ncbi:MAG: polysaccharide deacetylase family protein [Bacteroidetes bacterium]|nr:polysaccharide deacetylase family protein [Bacteroidota bacterium]
MKILVYSEHSSPRLIYVVEKLWSELTNIEAKLTCDVDFFLASNDIKINYSNQHFDQVIQIVPHGILFESGIKDQKTYYHQEKHVLCFEQNTFSEEWNYYDIFSIVFYITSRYEEYLPFTPDSHGRFASTQSVLHPFQLHEIPYVDIEINRFLIQLVKIYPEVVLPPKTYTPKLTIDIDRIYKYKGTLRIELLAKAIKNLITLNFKEFESIYNFSIKSEQDPFDSYQYIKTLTSSKKVETYIFYLLASYGKYDKNLLDFALIKNIYNLLKETANQGIHPSYASNTEPNLLNKELNLFETIIGTQASISRQHFLKLNLPSTYQNLLVNNIQQDFTMGWAESIGFRAGTSHSYTWFDLTINSETSLKITPFCAMDVTLKNYMNLNIEEAQEDLSKLKNIIQENGGQFITLWHNESLGNTGEWEGWRAVVEGIY